MGILIDAILGCAVIALPKGNFQLLALTAAVQTIASLKGRSKKQREEAQELLDEAASDSIPPATLTFEHVSCVIKGKAAKKAQGVAADGAKSDVKVILSDVSGTASPGRLMVLMGPSGSGKTSLLNALADHVAVTKGMTLSGKVLVCGDRLRKSNIRSGYVQQEDLFYSQMTVRETLDMVAALRLGRHASLEQRNAAVAAVIAKLGLADSVNTVVGDKRKRGLSGGEKKRLSIAAELISRPSLLFCDEPTTGLDAFQAQQVMQTLKDLANDGHTVVCSVHQPRSSIYELFDDLILLSEGRVVYTGPAGKALGHFEAQGHVCPSHYNPAEFLADIISRDNSSPEKLSASTSRIDKLVAAQSSAVLAAAGGNGADSESSDEGASAAPNPKAPLVLQTRLLLKRSWRQTTRDTAAIKLRSLANVQSAIVFGGIWWRLRKLQKSIPSRLGLLQVVAVYMSQSPLFKTLNVFPPEKSLVNNERASGSYDVLPYFLSKMIAELPIAALYPVIFSAITYPMCGLNPTAKNFGLYTLNNVMETLTSSALGLAVGATAPSLESALVLGPAVMLVFVVFGGLYTNQDDVPKVLRWLPSVSHVKRGYDALCANEFTGLLFEAEGPGSVTAGEQVLRRQGISNTVGQSLMGQGRIMLFHYWIAFCVLRAKVPRFQRFEQPAAADAVELSPDSDEVSEPAPSA